MTMQLIGGVLLVGLGLLLGATWSIQASQPKVRRQAEERRRLNAEWLAVRAARRWLDECPRCASSLTEQDWCVTPVIVKDPPDDDTADDGPVQQRGAATDTAAVDQRPERASGLDLGSEGRRFDPAPGRHC